MPLPLQSQTFADTAAIVTGEAVSPAFLPAVTYKLGGLYAGGMYSWSVAVADVNTDGKADLIAVSGVGTMVKGWSRCCSSPGSINI